MNREATADALGMHERASATPNRAELGQREEVGRAPDWALGELDLRRLEEWFLAAVSAPRGEPVPVDEHSASRLVTGSASLRPLERLNIYRRAYHARLIECLIDDYPVLQHALGETAFEDLCRAYIARYPSQAPSLNYFGRHMPEFCREQPLSASAFAADLATLEWAIVLCIHAETSGAIGLQDLSEVPSERFASARFLVNPSLRILRLDYPVNSYLQAYRQGKSPILPSARGSAVAVYRTGRSVWRLELEPTLVTLVESLAGGATLEAGLERVQALLADKSEQEAARLVGHCFQHAVASGLFSAISL